MRSIVLLSFVSVLALGGAAAAQAPAPTPAAPTPAAPTPAAPAPAAPAPAAPAPTSAPAAAPDAAAAQPAAPAPTSAPAPAPTDAAALRKTCVEAMNADKTFADSIVKVADENAAKVRLAKDLEQHELAAAAVAKNERHVLIAYASMWILAAGFLIFMWRRQQGLRLEILRLQRELDAAIKDGKDGK
jgi:hypothetical protein